MWPASDIRRVCPIRAGFSVSPPPQAPLPRKRSRPSSYIKLRSCRWRCQTRQTPQTRGIHCSAARRHQTQNSQVTRPHQRELMMYRPEWAAGVDGDASEDRVVGFAVAHLGQANDSYARRIMINRGTIRRYRCSAAWRLGAQHGSIWPGLRPPARRRIANRTHTGEQSIFAFLNLVEAGRNNA